MRNRLTIATENLVAYRRVIAPLSSLYKKADRRMEPIVEDVYGRLAAGEKLSEGARVIADIETKRKEARARTMRGAIDEFKEKHPRYGGILEGLIEEKRKKENIYLVYGRVGEADLPVSAYVKVLRELDTNLGISDATKLYKSLSDIADRLEIKRKEGLERVLIKSK
ncbi:MAG: hypothetical protein KAU20_06235 [Nanoarchaeota archaeon]|nr:hypothetical protein [Nanoarchaeota archaeon]